MPFLNAFYEHSCGASIQLYWHSHNLEEIPFYFIRYMNLSYDQIAVQKQNNIMKRHTDAEKFSAWDKMMLSNETYDIPFIQTFQHLLYVCVYIYIYIYTYIYICRQVWLKTTAFPFWWSYFVFSLAFKLVSLCQYPVDRWVALISSSKCFRSYRLIIFGDRNYLLFVLFNLFYKFSQQIRFAPKLNKNKQYPKT